MAKKMILAVLALFALLSFSFAQAEEKQGVLASNGVWYELAQDDEKKYEVREVVGGKVLKVELWVGEMWFTTPEVECQPAKRVSWLKSEKICPSREWVEATADGVVLHPVKDVVVEKFRYNVVLNLLALGVILIAVWLMRARDHIRPVLFLLSMASIFFVLILAVQIFLPKQQDFEFISLALLIVVIASGIFAYIHCLNRLPVPVYNWSLIIACTLLVNLFLIW